MSSERERERGAHTFGTHRVRVELNSSECGWTGGIGSSGHTVRLAVPNDIIQPFGRLRALR